MASFLDFEGVYSKTDRYMFYNWSAEDFVQHFGADSSYNDKTVVENHPAYDLRVKAGEMRELGQFEALTCTKHFVNREMMREALALEGKEKERAEMKMNDRTARKPYEDKTLSKIEANAESPFVAEMRAKIRAEEIAKLTPEVKTEDVKTEKTEEPKKMGRPKKVEEFAG